MFKNVPQIRKNVVRMQVKHLLKLSVLKKLRYQKRISLMDVFIISQPPLQIIFEWEQREKNNNITRNSSTSDVLTLLTLLSADEKSAVLLTVPSLTNVEVCIIPLVHFPKWLSLVYGQLATFPGHVKRSYVNANVSVSSIFSNGFPLEEIQLNVDCYVCNLNFYSSQY